MLLRIAHGLPWAGRATERTGVLYICPEGPKGLKRRYRAWHAHARAVALGAGGVLHLVLARDDELVQIPADAHVAVGRALLGGGVERGVGELLFLGGGHGRGLAEGGDGPAPDGHEERAGGEAGDFEELASVHGKEPSCCVKQRDHP